MTTDEFKQQMTEFMNLQSRCKKRFEFNPWVNSPQLGEDGAQTFDPHYVYHTAWAARILADDKPEKHVDIGSMLYFSTLVSAFVPVEHYDFRPPALYLENLFIGKQDVTKLTFPDDSIMSLSCMHVVEHVGLGRYGDAIDPDGDLKAISELKRVLAPGGQLLFVVPVGPQAYIFFNAHRTYTTEQVMSYFNMEITFYEPTPGCGCFIVRKV